MDQEVRGKYGTGLGGTEGGRSPTEVPPSPGAPPGSGGQGTAPNPEVAERPSRRTFTAGYKLRILQEADGCHATGELGALLRREGLYSSHLTSWRRQQQQGALAALGSKRRGRKAKVRNPLTAENDRLRQENQRLAARLKQAETIIDFQKKVCDLLGLTQPTSTENR
jgi:transposase-like protein